MVIPLPSAAIPGYMNVNCPAPRFGYSFPVPTGIDVNAVATSVGLPFRSVSTAFGSDSLASP